MRQPIMKVLVPALLLALGLWFYLAGQPPGESASVPILDRGGVNDQIRWSGPSGQRPEASGASLRELEVPPDQLLIVSTDGAPMAGVAVDLVDMAGGLEHLVSGPSGRVEPGGAGPWLVWIDDPGFLPYCGVAGGEAARSLQLVRGATVEATIDSGGFGLPRDLTLVLLPPMRNWPVPLSSWRSSIEGLASQDSSLGERFASLFEPQRAPEQRVEAMRIDGHEGGLMILMQNLSRAGALGRALGLAPTPSMKRHDAGATTTWSRVPPGTGYRWALDADLRASFEPQAAEPWTGSGPAVADCSGAFDLAEGQVISVRASLLPSGAIGGRIPPRLFDPWEAKVEASLWGAASGPGEQPIEGWLKAREVVPNDQGEFFFPALEPGKYRIEATWKEASDLTAFDMATCELAPFETLDVGLLAAEDGIVEQLILELVDAAGNPLAPSSVLQDPGSFEVWLYFGPQSTNIDDIFVQRLPLRLDTPLSLKGIPASEYSIRWDFKSHFELVTPSNERVWSLRKDNRYMRPILLGGSTKIPIVVDSEFPLTLELPRIEDFVPVMVTCLVFSPDSPPWDLHVDKRYVGEVEGKRTVRLLPLETSLAPGRKRIIACFLESSTKQAGAPSAQAKFLDFEFDVPGQRVLVAPRLQAACVATGKVDPSLLWASSVYAVPTPAGYQPHNGSFGRSTMQPDGSFRIEGLAANMQYMLQGFEDESLQIPFSTGAPGTVTTIP